MRLRAAVVLQGLLEPLWRSVILLRSGLEFESDRQLNPPGAVGTVRRSVSGVDRSERVWVRNVEIRLTRIGEVRVVQDVEEIGGELAVQALRDSRVLADTQIEVLIGEPSDGIRAAAAAVGAQQHGTKARDRALPVGEVVVAGSGDRRVQADRNGGGLDRSRCRSQSS